MFIYPMDKEEAKDTIIASLIAYSTFRVHERTSRNLTVIMVASGKQVDCFPHNVAQAISDCTPYNDNLISSIALGNMLTASGHTVSVTRIIWNTQGNSHAKV